jgi:hypothetical protein
MVPTTAATAATAAFIAEAAAAATASGGFTIEAAAAAAAGAAASGAFIAEAPAAATGAACKLGSGVSTIPALLLSGIEGAAEALTRVADVREGLQGYASASAAAASERGQDAGISNFVPDFNAVASSLTAAADCVTPAAPSGGGGGEVAPSFTPKSCHKPPLCRRASASVGGEMIFSPRPGHWSHQQDVTGCHQGSLV